MELINTNEKFANFCKILENQKFITVDSEFLREHYYYPMLCLLQVGYDGGAAVIDPIANLDMTPFFAILDNADIVKVFHAGKQDVEIFYNLTGKLPNNIFDTQIAAMVCGFGENVSYGTLVKSITGVELDKSCRLTDWSIRPLDEEQVNYAANDVTYLVDCYKYIINYLEENKRTDWIKEEMLNAYDEKYYHIEAENSWQRIHNSIRSPKFLTALKYLAMWREKRAQKFNTPRQSIIRDDVLVNLASVRPLNVDDLKQVRNLKNDVIKGKLGAEIIEALQEAEKNPMSAEECKISKTKDINIPNQEHNLMEVLYMLLHIQSQEHNVVAKLVASENDLRYFVRGEDNKTGILHGWRYEIFGQYALKLRSGELSISYNPQKKRIIIT